MDAKALEQLSFEEGYERLEQIIRKLEEGQLSLEESLALYEEGVRLARHCEHALDAAELRVTQLLMAASEETPPSDWSEAREG
ncbi:MAG: exodeoxyribonuclease VII small subunit [Chloroflexi bacterium]|nr:exodeoxyribonuclease VII small subunit [Chloroflexota bacterium]